MRIRINNTRKKYYQASSVGPPDPDPDPLVQGTDPDLSIIKQK
jgi:hypothetical protein